MKRTQKLRYFALGLMVALLISVMVNPALAALTSKNIKVSTGVNLYVDDNKFIPKDVNGNPVEVFIYNGTTYLPARALSEVVGKPIQWEGATSSVYIGKHSSSTPAVLLQDLDYYTGGTVYTETSLKDNLGNTRYNVVSSFSSLSSESRTNVYKINGEYTKISGTLFQRYEYRDRKSSGATLKIYGDGKLLYTAEMTGGMNPIDFSINLTGVLGLKIYFHSGSASGGAATAAIANFGLYT